MSWPEYIVQIEPHEDGELFHMKGEPEPIVRCRDCKFANHEDCKMFNKQHLDCFCAWGERR